MRKKSSVPKYGQLAILATELYKSGNVNSPRDAWDKAAESIFPSSYSSQKKGCPRGAYLGLCEEGIILGIPKGEYCESDKNKEYALKAIDLLRKEPGLSNNKKILWLRVIERGEKTSNNQMDVVISLLNAGLILD